MGDYSFGRVLHAVRSIAQLAIAVSHISLISQTSSDPEIIEGMAPSPERLRKDALMWKQFALEAAPL